MMKVRLHTGVAGLAYVNRPLGRRTDIPLAVPGCFLIADYIIQHYKPLKSLSEVGAGE